MARTHVILDGLQDARQARQLSKAWAGVGIDNTVDPSGQCGSIEAPKDDSTTAAQIASRFGLILRDRVGTRFTPNNSLDDLRRHVIGDYRARLVTAFMYGLPALVLHYVGPKLAGSNTGASLAFAWIIEMLLTGWVITAAAWPILWQGTAAILHRRLTGDSLTTLIIAASFLPSVFGLFSLPLGNHAWFAHPTVGSGNAPAFHAAILAVWIAVLQRWLAHRAAGHLSGRASQMIYGYEFLVAGWIVGCVAFCALRGWWLGLALGLAFPPMLSLGAVNRWSPGLSMALPVIGFGGLMILAPVEMRQRIAGWEIETGAAFSLLMTGVMAWGWREGKGLSTAMHHQHRD